MTVSDRAFVQIVAHAVADHVGLDTVLDWQTRYESSLPPFEALALIVEAHRLDLLQAVLTPSRALSDRHLSNDESAHAQDDVKDGIARLNRINQAERCSRSFGEHGLVLLSYLRFNPWDFGPFIPGMDQHRTAYDHAKGKISQAYDHRRNRQAAPKDSDARLAFGLNMVGLAVLHGWAEGATCLMDHGFDPWSCPRHDRNPFHDALTVAMVFNEPACAVALLNHPRFERGVKMQFKDHRSDSMWRLVDGTTQGYVWNLLCRSSLPLHPDVQRAMQERWTTMPTSVQTTLMNHDPEAHRRWETCALTLAAGERTISTTNLLLRARL